MAGRNVLLRMVCFVFVIITMATANESDIPKRPNIVFVMADDLGYSDIGYHSKQAVTPNLDRLAKEGVTLENYYVQPICSPTRTTFFSGRSQIHTGLQHKNILRLQPNGLPLDSLTMADKLKEAGYSTHLVGKWHMGYYRPQYLPTRRGFDSFYGLYLGASGYYSHKACLGRHCYLDLHNDTKTTTQPDFRQNRVYSTHIYTREAKRIIEQQAKKDSPFFLLLSHQAVHGPQQVPSKYKRVVKRKYKQFLKSKRKFYGGRKGSKLTRHRLTHLAQALTLDESVGKVVNLLKKTGLWNNTVLVFSTDNGGSLRHGASNYPLKGAKGSYYEGGIRAVGFVTSPLLNQTGTINRELIHVSDWFPTFMSLANGNLRGTHDVNGFNQWKTLSLGTPSPRTEILFNIDPKSKKYVKQEFSDHDFDTSVLAAFRKGDYKIITGINNAFGLSLYNVKTDPSEKIDLGGQTEYRDKVVELLDDLVRYNKTAVPVRYPNVDKVEFKQGVWGPWK